jgi:hypothetical protein
MRQCLGLTIINLLLISLSVLNSIERMIVGVRKT